MQKMLSAGEEGQKAESGLKTKRESSIGEDSRLKLASGPSGVTEANLMSLVC